jgi:hypothetical protein
VPVGANYVIYAPTLLAGNWTFSNFYVERVNVSSVFTIQLDANVSNNVLLQNVSDLCDDGSQCESIATTVYNHQFTNI